MYAKRLALVVEENGNVITSRMFSPLIQGDQEKVTRELNIERDRWDKSQQFGNKRLVIKEI